MKHSFPQQDLTCPTPKKCPVVINAFSRLSRQAALPEVTISAARSWFRVYDAQDGHSQPNPGYGDTRFAPFDALDLTHRVPTMYLAETLTAALLETSFHDLDAPGGRVLDEQTLHGKLHARVLPPRDLSLVDLRDEQLEALNIPRAGVSSNSAEHYPCTRNVAQMLHQAGFDGILWHSRQAEMSGLGRAEVLIVFCDRVPHTRNSWRLAAPRNAYGSLLEGTGRLRLDELAESLEAAVVPMDPGDDVLR